MINDLSKLIYRRQFILSNNELNDLSDWNHLQIALESYYWTLLSHPDLEITYSEYESVKLLLIGYIVDPYHPADSNDKVVNRIIKLKYY